MNFLSNLRRPDAVAYVRGMENYVQGVVRFYPTDLGILVRAEISGLPSSSGIYAFHIHEGSDCSAPGTHFNPGGLQHPYHAGDLPPLLSANGRAFSLFLTDRFALRQIIGKTVVIHSNPDDFASQPSGNPGKILACGQIRSHFQR